MIIDVLNIPLRYQPHQGFSTRCLIDCSGTEPVVVGRDVRIGNPINIYKLVETDGKDILERIVISENPISKGGRYNNELVAPVTCRRFTADKRGKFSPFGVAYRFYQPIKYALSLCYDLRGHVDHLVPALEYTFELLCDWYNYGQNRSKSSSISRVVEENYHLISNVMTDHDIAQLVLVMSNLGFTGFDPRRDSLSELRDRSNGLIDHVRGACYDLETCQSVGHDVISSSSFMHRISREAAVRMQIPPLDVEPLDFVNNVDDSYGPAVLAVLNYLERIPYTDIDVFVDLDDNLIQIRDIECRYGMVSTSTNLLVSTQECESLYIEYKHASRRTPVSDVVVIDLAERLRRDRTIAWASIQMNWLEEVSIEIGRTDGQSVDKYYANLALYGLGTPSLIDPIAYNRMID